jgi:hypothetical protein
VITEEQGAEIIAHLVALVSGVDRGVLILEWIFIGVMTVAFIAIPIALREK